MSQTELQEVLAFLQHVWHTHGQEVAEELMRRSLNEEQLAAVLAHGSGKS
jgi:hypothetical protein